MATISCQSVLNACQPLAVAAWECRYDRCFDEVVRQLIQVPLGWLAGDPGS
jgi:hypothetical protein